MEDDDKNPLLRMIEANHRKEREQEATFRKWFEIRSSSINPLMKEEDARKIFGEAFDLGVAYSHTEFLNSISAFMADAARKREK